MVEVVGGRSGGASPAEAVRDRQPLRVVVDLNRCQGYAQCCYAAPAHFAIEGHEALFYDPAPAASARGDVERARIACPVQAIRVEDGVGRAL